MYLSGVSSSVFFFSFFLHCCCASVWVFVCSSHCLQAEGWRVASSPGQGFTPYQGPPSLASPFIRDHRLYLQLPAPAGTSPSLPQASGFLGRPLAPSGLSSEDPKGRCGAEVPQAGSCRCQEKGQHRTHTGLPHPNCSLPLPLHPRITLGK